MSHTHSIILRKFTLGAILATLTTSPVLATDVETAAANVLKGLKFAPQGPAIPSPTTVPQLSATTSIPAPPAPANQALTTSADSTPLAMPEATPPATLTLEADGSGIPADLAKGELDASAGTGDEGFDDGSADIPA